MTATYTVFARDEVTKYLSVVDMDLTARQARRLAKKMNEAEAGEVTYFAKDVVKRKGA
jgi:hypothetical protein